MTASERHTIQVDDAGNDRAYWQCDCGSAGSCASERADVAAERHVPEGALVVYRSSGARSR